MASICKPLNSDYFCNRPGFLCAASFQPPQPRQSHALDHWKGLRAESGKCQFLSWNNNLKPDGRFTITFSAMRSKPSRFKPRTAPGVAADPTGDCQEDYEFTEHRIRG
ncbi:MULTISPECIES: hypothetical protein [unclassified Pseudomonas]|uniref:hypothetical protein n=1 Tax=unclassified Pseudomonas TaxID=196821 RepID=UPI0035285D1E